MFGFPSSVYVVKSPEDLVIVLAGFPGDLTIQSDGFLDGLTIDALRKLKPLPGDLEISIPYRIMPDTIINVKVLGPETS